MELTEKIVLNFGDEHCYKKGFLSFKIFAFKQFVKDYF